MPADDPIVTEVTNTQISSPDSTGFDSDKSTTSSPESTETPESKSPQNSLVRDILNVARGFCMGAADTVPGVSGGTVALILGHYERLVTGISRIDSTALSLVSQRRFAQAWKHIDGRFMVALGAGVGAGVVCLAGLMHWLLDHRMPETFAVFFGLILASIWIVIRYVDKWTPKQLGACAMGIAVAAGIGFCAPAAGSTSLPYLFLSGSVAICAMILPGISGAFVLILLGVYLPITGMIKDAAKGDFSPESLLQMGVFAFGCLFGLLAFSRILRWLLAHHQGTTMSALVGLMVGSMVKLWPLQTPTPATAGLKMKERVMQYVSPSEWPGSLLTLIALAVLAAAAVLFLERIAAKDTPPSAQ